MFQPVQENPFKRNQTLKMCPKYLSPLNQSTSRDVNIRDAVSDNTTNETTVNSKRVIFGRILLLHCSVQQAVQI